MNNKCSCLFLSNVFDKKYNKWQARTRIDGKSICFGSFDKIEDALAARVKGVNKLFGDFTNNDEKI